MSAGTTLALYLSRAILLRATAAVLVLVMLGLSIDLIKSATELIEEKGVPALFGYAGFRSIQIAGTLFPAGVLIGAASAFLTLGLRSEVAIVRATGVSMFGIVLRLLPLALLLGGAFHVLGDRPAVWASERLAKLAPKTTDAPDIGAAVWSRITRAGTGEIVRARLGARDGTALDDLTIWHLSDSGEIIDRFTAKRAEFINERWRLGEVENQRTGTAAVQMVWDTILTPTTVKRLAAGSNLAVSTDVARSALAGLVLPTRSEDYYATRIARSYAALAVPFVMLLLAAPAGLGLNRTEVGIKNAAIGITVGLLYVAVDGFAQSLSEIGAVDPTLAAAIPPALFALAGYWALFMLES